MDTKQMATNIRLNALEAIVQKMLVSELCRMSPSHSRELKQAYIESTSRYDVLLPGTPVEMNALELEQRVFADHVLRFFQAVEVREKGARERHNLPPIDPL